MSEGELSPADVAKIITDSAAELNIGLMDRTKDFLREKIASAIRREREACLRICEAEEKAFLSPQYAADQPLGSFCERFACSQIADAIRTRP